MPLLRSQRPIPHRGRRLSLLASNTREARRCKLVEAVDEAVLVRAGIGPEGFRTLHQDLVGIRAECCYCLCDELVKRHGLFGLSAVHEVGADPWRRDS